MYLFKLLRTLLIIGLFITPASEIYSATEHSDEVPADKIQQFVDIFKKIKQQYVDEVDDEQLFDYAIKGMVQGLDPHSSFLSEDDFKELKIGTTGRFGGLGIEITTEDGFVKVVSPIDDTPASRAGIKTGDLIIKVGDKSLKDLNINEAVKLMRGTPGTNVEITIVRKQLKKPLVLEITRQIIISKGIKSTLFEKNIGYLRLASFQSNSTNDLRNEVYKLKKETNNALSGLILDLRNNPGGVLGAAVGISDLFIKSGKIVYTKGRIKNGDLEYYATPQDILEGAPIIVIINEGSASASEIVAGALQDSKRATVVGEKSYGKASVQTIQELNNGAALKLTTARYYTPLGRDIHKAGIVPDIIYKKEDTDKVQKVELDPPYDEDIDLYRTIELLKEKIISAKNGQRNSLSLY